MPEEITIEDLPTPVDFAVGRTGAFVLTTFAIYGAYTVGRQGFAKAKQIREDRKAKKASKVAAAPVA